MQIDAALISRLEKLSRLQLGDAEREKLTGDLQRILDMVDTLRSLDTENVEPLVYLSDAVNVLRNDELANNLLPRKPFKMLRSKTDSFLWYLK